MATDADEIFNMVDKIITTVDETYDNFIFECVKPWTQNKTQMIIHKQLLVNAIREYQKNHPEECAKLMEQYRQEHLIERMNPHA